jgi:uncharacterized protein (TIGR02594 family)
MNDAYLIARRLENIVKEIPGDKDDPFIIWALSLCKLSGKLHDEIAWCSAGMNAVHLLAGKVPTFSAAARSWLGVGEVIPINQAQVGDVVIIKRKLDDPGPEVIKALGHVTFFVEWHGTDGFLGYGANQNNCFSTDNYPKDRILGVRRT